MSEELTELRKKLQETESQLSSEVTLLKEQLQAEQNSKNSLEAKLSIANDEIG